MVKNLSVVFIWALMLLVFVGCTPSSEGANASEVADQKEPEAQYVYGFDLKDVEIVEDTVRHDENISEILTKYDVGWETIKELAMKSKRVFDLRNLKANNRLEFIYDRKDSSHQVMSVIYHPNKLEYVRFDLKDSIKVSLNKFEVVKRDKVITGVIRSSLYEAIAKAGGSPSLAYMMSDVYAWQIDFFGLRRSDHFKVLYRELVVKDEVVGVERILASEITHNGKKYDAYWFEKDSTIADYYDSKGMSMKKSFLKAPLKFKRISSKFSYSRMHPVFHYLRPHLGVDYAAPSGTPVVTVGDGVVIKKGYSGGAGHMIKIKHDKTYTTAYLHLRAYAKGIANGKKVTQGQVIGYVGSTGASTGPHLDYRVWKDGKNIDPLKMKLTSAKSLDPQDKVLFKMEQNQLYQRLYGKTPKPAKAPAVVQTDSLI